MVRQVVREDPNIVARIDIHPDIRHTAKPHVWGERTHRLPFNVVKSRPSQRLHAWTGGETSGPAYPAAGKSITLNAWCELFGQNLSGRCPQIRVGLLTNAEGKGPTPYARCGHLPHHTLRYGRRLLPLPRAENETRTRGVSLCKRGDHPGYLRPVVQVRQREGFLPLRPDQAALCFSYPARPLAVQPLRASAHRTHRGFRLASDGSAADAKVPLRSAGQLGYAYPGLQASRAWMDGRAG